MRKPQAGWRSEGFQEESKMSGVARNSTSRWRKALRVGALAAALGVVVGVPLAFVLMGLIFERRAAQASR